MFRAASRDSDSGWKLLCSTNGEIPTEPPEPPSTTEAPSADVTHSTDPNRFSKAVKVANGTAVNQPNSAPTTESSSKSFPASDPLNEDVNSLQDPNKHSPALNTDGPFVASGRDTSSEQLGECFGQNP